MGPCSWSVCIILHCIWFHLMYWIWYPRAVYCLFNWIFICKSDPFYLPILLFILLLFIASSAASEMVAWLCSSLLNFAGGSLIWCSSILACDCSLICHSVLFFDNAPWHLLGVDVKCYILSEVTICRGCMSICIKFLLIWDICIVMSLDCRVWHFTIWN